MNNLWLDKRIEEQAAYYGISTAELEKLSELMAEAQEIIEREDNQINY